MMNPLFAPPCSDLSHLRILVDNVFNVNDAFQVKLTQYERQEQPLTN